MGDSHGASNVLSVVVSLLCLTSLPFPPIYNSHRPMVYFTFFSFLLFPPPPSLRFLPSLFSRSLKGGHEGDNANTGPLNREWEEDSCWRWQRWLLKRNLSLFPLACCGAHIHTLTVAHAFSPRLQRHCNTPNCQTQVWEHTLTSMCHYRHTHRHVCKWTHSV